MDTNPNIGRLLAMLDNPEAYTEQEIYDLIHSDEETLEAYRCMVAAKQAYRHRQTRQPADAEAAWQRFERKTSPLRFGWQKIAASFIAVAFLGGLAFAAYHFLSPRKTLQQTEVTAPSLTGRAGGESVRFTNARLDSILPVVAGHYGRKVCFRDEASRELRFTITWNRWQPIASFASSLNEFDGLRLTDEHDTLFVESVESKEE